MSNQDFAPSFSPSDAYDIFPNRTAPSDTVLSSNGGSVTTSSSSTSAAFAWRAFFLFLLWAIGLIILINIIVGVCCCKRNHQQDSDKPQHNEQNKAKSPPGNSEEEDVESNESDNSQNDHHKYAGKAYRNWMHVIAVTLSTFLAFILSIAVHVSCTMLDFIDDSETSISTLGLWKADLPALFDNDEAGICYSNFRVPYFDVASALVVARIFAVLTSILGGIWFTISVMFGLQSR